MSKLRHSHLDGVPHIRDLHLGAYSPCSPPREWGLLPMPAPGTAQFVPPPKALHMCLHLPVGVHYYQVCSGTDSWPHDILSLVGAVHCVQVSGSHQIQLCRKGMPPVSLILPEHHHVILPQSLHSRVSVTATGLTRASVLALAATYHPRHLRKWVRGLPRALRAAVVRKLTQHPPAAGPCSDPRLPDRPSPRPDIVTLNVQMSLRPKLRALDVLIREYQYPRPCTFKKQVSDRPTGAPPAPHHPRPRESGWGMRHPSLQGSGSDCDQSPRPPLWTRCMRKRGEPRSPAPTPWGGSVPCKSPASVSPMRASKSTTPYPTHAAPCSPPTTPTLRPPRLSATLASASTPPPSAMASSRGGTTSRPPAFASACSPPRTRRVPSVSYPPLGTTSSPAHLTRSSAPTTIGGLQPDSPRGAVPGATARPLPGVPSSSDGSNWGGGCPSPPPPLL